MPNICFNCFKTIPNEGKCPYCGYDVRENADKYPLALLPGTVLINRYLVGRVLGQGGFGITYIALDRNTRSAVAIKEYLPVEIASRNHANSRIMLFSGDKQEDYEYGKGQFLEEAKTLASFVGNEHIIRILNYFEANSTAYYAMEYIQGQTLKQMMESTQRPLRVEEANQYLLPIMESLEWVHSKGVVHRDISPDNIMIRTDGTAKLIDFGAARISTGEKSRSLDIILKHGFAPKEQYTRRGRQGPYTDVYAMAATYYYAITGKVPPDAIERSDRDELIPPSLLGTEIRGDTEEVLLKALSVLSGDRYQTMAAFYSAMLMTMPHPFTPEATSATRQEKKEWKKTQKIREAELKRTSGGSGNEKQSSSKKWLAVGAPAAVMALVLMLFLLRSPMRPLPFGGRGGAESERIGVEQTEEQLAEEAAKKAAEEEAQKRAAEIEAARIAAEEKAAEAEAARKAAEEKAAEEAANRKAAEEKAAQEEANRKAAEEKAAEEEANRKAAEEKAAEEEANRKAAEEKAAEEEANRKAAEEKAAEEEANRKAAEESAAEEAANRKAAEEKAAEEEANRKAAEEKAAEEEANRKAAEESANEEGQSGEESEPELPHDIRTVGSVIKFGSYEQDNITSNGPEEIEWIVLAVEENRSLLISRYALDKLQYETHDGIITWADAHVRRWLNNDFMNSAFTKEEQKKLERSAINNHDNQGNPDFSGRGGADTKDHVFLLSYADIMEYMSDPNDRVCTPTNYAKQKGVLIYTGSGKRNGNCGWWWLRSPGDKQYNACGVRQDGTILDQRVDYSKGAIRPAIWYLTAENTDSP